MGTAHSSPLAYYTGLTPGMSDVPLDWRSAIVTALYKKGSRTDVSNYRPVSLTCITCKRMESLVRDHLMKFFLSNKLFSNCQYGFISTVLQLLHILDKWTKLLDEGRQVDVIYTNFEKAFDKVSHKRLLSKLRSYGVREDLIEWIKGFLVHRRHQVRVSSQPKKSLNNNDISN